MEITAVCKKDNFHYMYWSLMKNQLDISDNEIKILCKFIYHYMDSEGSREDIRWKYVFSTDIRKEIREVLGIPDSSFNQSFHKLKNKKIKMLNGPAILKDDNGYKLDKRLCVPFYQKLIFNFKEPSLND